MTQIKLRRDTSANFTSANPILGVGEPAYETDTKKLKIGDGTTAYTQLEYFSAGGGGSTNITATLPLKIVDGVISLEVDGQTIQIVDGKLHANLDELGNKVNSLTGEVNSLTGEVTDLSGRVTAAEADILTKQDVFNPIGALQLKIVTSENLIGYTETPDTITTSTFCTFTGSTGRTPESQAYTSVSQISNSTALDACISIPINGANNIVKIPTVEEDKLSLGYYNEDGTYIPVIANINATSDSYPFNSQYTYQGAFREIQTVHHSGYYDINRKSDWVVRMYISTSNGASGYSNSPEYASKLGQCTYLQFNTDPDTGLLKCFQFWSIKGNWCYWGTADERLNTNMREQLNKITHVVIGGAGYRSTVTYNKSDFGVYEADGRVHWSMPALISALDGKPNLLNLFSSTTTRSLVINTTDNLKVTNGELDVGTTVTTQGNTFNGANQLVKLDSSGKLPAVDGSNLTNLPGGGSAPTNMVTTDTAQTISGQKEFGKTILFLSNNDLLRAQQSTSYRNGAGLSMGANSTSTDGGVFAPQWKIYDTTGNVDRTETIITTYNQSKLNSSNFNTANKLVKLDSDGKLPAIDGSQLTNLPGGGSAPTNMVTTDTAQDITGTKSFTTGETTFKNTDSNRKILGEINSNGFYCNYYIDQASGEKPCYLGKVAERVFNMGIPELAGVTGRIYANTLTKWNGNNEVGTILDSSNLGSYVDGTTITYTNNKLTATGGGSAPTNMVTTDTTQTITGAKTFENKLIFNRPDSDAAEQSSILGGEFKLGTSNYDNSIYANQLLLNANTTNAGTFKVQTFSTHFTQINGATITSQRTGTGAYKIINTIRPSGNSSNKNYSVLYSEVDDSYNHKLTINNLSSDLVLAGKTVKDGSGNKFLTSGDKEAIMGYIMPDYSTRTEVPWNTDNTAPTDGYVEVFGEGDGSTSAFVLEYTINGVKTAVSACYATSRNTNFRLPVICPKGTVYSAKGGAVGHGLHFISMKGAV